MTTYIIARIGSNAANQSMIQRMVMGTVEAKNRVEALSKASSEWNCYSNQRFEIIQISKAKGSDIDAANDADALTAE
jgi:hypothetical protein